MRVPTATETGPVQDRARRRCKSKTKHKNSHAGWTRPRGLHKTNAANAVACTNRTDPFGTTHQPGTTPCDDTNTKNTAFYRGARRDTATGNYQFGSRTYDPTKNTFLTPDTYRAGQPDQNLGLTTDPLTRNTYTYVNGDPVNLVDPYGHEPRELGRDGSGQMRYVMSASNQQDQNRYDKYRAEELRLAGDGRRAARQTQLQAILLDPISRSGVIPNADSVRSIGALSLAEKRQVALAITGASRYYNSGMGGGLTPAAGMAMGQLFLALDGHTSGDWRATHVRDNFAAEVLMAAVGGGAVAGVGRRAVSAVDDIARAPNTASGGLRTVADEVGEVRSYPSYRKAQADLGTNSSTDIHHIVEQCQCSAGRSGFSVSRVNSTDNMIRIPGGVHDRISAYYASRPPGFSTTVRNTLNGMPFEQQYDFGLDVIRRAMGGSL